MRKIAILELPCRGNEEFQPILGNPGFDAARVTPQEFHARFPDGADVILIPGSRETGKDLIFMQESGGIDIIRRHLARGGIVMGICGGFQMMGEALHDPYRTNGPLVSSKGMGLLPISTHFGPKMLLCKTEADLLAGRTRTKVAGVEGRSGASYTEGRHSGFSPLLEIRDRKSENPIPKPVVMKPDMHWAKPVNWAPGSEAVDGLVSHDRRIWGTYLHLIFHNHAFMEEFFSHAPGS